MNSSVPSLAMMFLLGSPLRLALSVVGTVVTMATLVWVARRKRGAPPWAYVAICVPHLIMMVRAWQLAAFGAAMQGDHPQQSIIAFNLACALIAARWMLVETAVLALVSIGLPAQEHRRGWHWVIFAVSAILLLLMATVPGQALEGLLPLPAR